MTAVKSDTGVVVTYHNQASTTGKCLRSLRRSSNLYIVMVDDGSERPPPIELRHLVNETISFPESLGVQEARNYGFDRIRSHGLSNILFTDGDVEWRDLAVNVLRDALKDSSDDTAYAYCDCIRGGVFSGTSRAGKWSADRLRSNNYISTMSLCRMEALPKPPFVVDEERFQDWSLWLRLLRRGYKGVYVPQVLFTAYYKRGDTSLKGMGHWRGEIQSRYVD